MGPAIVISYVVSGVSALFSVFYYAEFAVEIPVAGSISCTLVFVCAQFHFAEFQTRTRLNLHPKITILNIGLYIYIYIYIYI